MNFVELVNFFNIFYQTNSNIRMNVLYALLYALLGRYQRPFVSCSYENVLDAWLFVPGFKAFSVVIIIHVHKNVELTSCTLC